ncbi:MAG TPA: SUMF1/EgtB/PvdO family nonheme iron enzyme, partial [Pirellulales bacterium]|nr:SUMF1/EgtB/PvdO family nonheme iron enzyme [Pirellulales bacterium]
MKHILFVVVLAVAAASPLQAEDTVNQRWALLIAVNDYEGLDDLQCPAADMHALREELVAQGFPPRQVFLMDDAAKKNVDRPFRANIQRQLEQVLGMAEKDDLVLVAFSGHGVYLDKTSWLCPLEARLDETDTLVSLDSVYQRLAKCKGAMKLLLVDACRDEPRLPGRKSAGGPDVTSQFGIERPPRGILQMSSCAPGQVSMEDRELGHGVFMHYIIAGLRGKADADKSGGVSLSELYKYANLETKLHVKNKYNGFQTPSLTADLSDDFDIGHVRGATFPGRRAPIREADGPVGRPSQAVSLESAHGDGLGSPPHGADDLGRSPHGEAPRDVTNSIGMKLRLIPAGRFWMGSPESEVERGGGERRHQVRITRPFYLGVYEVTQAEYKRVMGDNPSDFSSGGKAAVLVSGLDTRRFPVENVSWDDATDFCEKLSDRAGERAAGRRYRLPTEAEWEYACRAGTTTPFHFGGELSGRGANCNGNYPYGTSVKGPYLGRTTTVGSYRDRANAFGLYDMHGNVWEWCADWYDSKYYDDSAADDPQGPAAGSFRVIRGGGWDAARFAVVPPAATATRPRTVAPASVFV